MASIIYGNGNCSIGGSGEARAIQITYKGSIKIIDRTSNSFYIATKNNKIVIFPLGEGFLSNLFDYEGEFRINTILVSDNNGERLPTTIRRAMDYAEMLGTSESLTTNSEDLNSDYISKGKTKRNYVVNSKVIEDNHTSQYKNLYLEDGTKYEGNIHIHLDGSIMTGSRHVHDSQDLYFKKRGRLVSNRLLTRQKPKKPKKRIRTTTTGGGY